jgi:hypothetical protein
MFRICRARIRDGDVKLRVFFILRTSAYFSWPFRKPAGTRLLRTVGFIRGAILEGYKKLLMLCEKKLTGHKRDTWLV